MGIDTFFTLGFIIAIAGIFEALTLQKSQGRFSKLVFAISLLETCWMITCVYALFTINFPSWSIIIPTGYIAYFIVATWHFRNIGDGIETMEDLMATQLPVGAVKLSFLASILLLILNGAALVLI